MNITERQIELVQTSWSKVKPISSQASELFYGRLIELDPNLKPLFTTDIKEQGRKLMQMIGAAVNGLNQIDSMVPVVENLGKRHVSYGVKDEDYETVGEALIWTLNKGLGDEFTNEVKQAWTDVYILLATTMKNSAMSVEVES